MARIEKQKDLVATRISELLQNIAQRDARVPNVTALSVVHGHIADIVERSTMACVEQDYAITSWNLPQERSEA